MDCFNKVKRFKLAEKIMCAYKLDSQKVNRLVKHSAEINCFCVFIRAIPRKFRYHISISYSYCYPRIKPPMTIHES